MRLYYLSHVISSISLHLSFLWPSSPSTRQNCLLFISSLPSLFALLTSLWLSLSKPYILLINLNYTILVAILFSLYIPSHPCPNSLAYLCSYHLHSYTCILTFSWYSSTRLFVSSISIFLSFLWFYSPCPDIIILVRFIFSLYWFLCFYLSLFLARFSSSWLTLFSLDLIRFKHYQRYQRLWQGVNIKSLKSKRTN